MTVIATLAFVMTPVAIAAPFEVVSTQAWRPDEGGATTENLPQSVYRDGVPR